MTETIKFVDGVNYTEADQADFNMAMRPQGILPENALGVLNWSAIGGLFIRVVPGVAFIRGFLYKNDANKDIAVGANSSGSVRIDTLVVRVNPTANTAVAQLVVGTPGAGAPALTQVAGGIWDFPLADITVANGAATIIAGNVTDRRVMSLWPASTLDAAMATDVELANVSNMLTAEGVTRAAADSALNALIGAWTAFTPILVQGVTVTTTLVYGRYCIIGKVAFVQILFTVPGSPASPGTAGQIISITTIPAAIRPRNFGVGAICGSAFWQDLSAPVYRALVAEWTDATHIQFYDSSTSGYTGQGIASRLRDFESFGCNLSYELP